MALHHSARCATGSTRSRSTAVKGGMTFSQLSARSGIRTHTPRRTPGSKPGTSTIPSHGLGAGLCHPTLRRSSQYNSETQNKDHKGTTLPDRLTHPLGCWTSALDRSRTCTALRPLRPQRSVSTVPPQTQISGVRKIGLPLLL